MQKSKFSHINSHTNFNHDAQFRGATKFCTVFYDHNKNQKSFVLVSYNIVLFFPRNDEPRTIEGLFNVLLLLYYNLPTNTSYRALLNPGGTSRSSSSTNVQLSYLGELSLYIYLSAEKHTVLAKLIMHHINFVICFDISADSNVYHKQILSGHNGCSIKNEIDFNSFL